MDADYSISYVGGSLTVTPAPLTITANNQTMVVHTTVPTLTASYTGLVNGDTAASLTTQPTLTTNAKNNSPISGNPYPITVSGAVDADYSISYVNGTLIVINQPATTVTLTVSPGSTSTYGAGRQRHRHSHPHLRWRRIRRRPVTIQFQVDGSSFGSRRHHGQRLGHHRFANQPSGRHPHDHGRLLRRPTLRVQFPVEHSDCHAGGAHDHRPSAPPRFTAPRCRRSPRRTRASSTATPAQA